MVDYRASIYPGEVILFRSDQCFIESQTNPIIVDIFMIHSKTEKRSGINRRKSIYLKILVSIITIILSAIILLIAVNWAPDRPVSELQTRWAPPPSTFVDVAGMKVHLRDEGPRDDSLPIVLLHGTSSSLHTWEG
ncbi:MAG: hypothetical protein AB1489_34075, partial [Acidobacteriota bacterium]